MFPFTYNINSLYVLIFLAYVLLSLIVGFTANRLFRKENKADNAENEDELRNAERSQNVHARGGRQNRRIPPDERDQDDESSDGMRDPLHVEPMGKIGAKKRAKLEAKAERKMQRETETKLREERRVQQEEEEKERKMKEDQERLEEQKQEEERIKAEEEQRRKEEEEYQKLKESFSVEAEGYEAGSMDEDDGGNLLKRFIDHLKETKIVMVEDVAHKFNLKAQSALDRIQQLQSDGLITGVVDDRGKFIYITEDELKAVADFIKKRGRVTLEELVENSNKLITLDQSISAGAA